MFSFLRLLAASLALFMLPHVALALNPEIGLQDLNHAAWNEKDGVPADIRSMAQTRDGWLWLGTANGLYRFDGIRFEQFLLNHNRVYSLHATATGDLLIGYELGGLSLLHADGRVEQLADPKADQLGSLGSMGIDRDGAVWAAGMRGLHRYQHGKWRTIASGVAWTGAGVSVLIDQYGRVWSANEHGVYLYDRASGRLNRVGGQELGGSLIQSPDGRLWSAAPEAVRPVPAPPPAGRPLPRDPGFNQAESRWGGQFDRDGNLWALRCPFGICRVNRAGARPSTDIVPSRQSNDRLDQHWQLSALSTNVVLEDREGNVWVATQAGLDRFRENKLIPVRLPGATGVYSLAGDNAGGLWAAEAGDGALWRIAPDGQPVRDSRPYIGMLANDRDGAVLLVGKRDIERLHQGRSTRIPLPRPPGAQSSGTAGLDVLGVMDDGKVLWMASRQTGLMGRVDGRWLARSAFNLPPRIFLSAPGGSGQLWLSHNDGGLSFYDNGKLGRYDISMVGVESGIFPGDQLVVAGERGIAVLHGATFVKLAPHNVDALSNVTGMAVTPDGDRWLNGSKGVVHVRRADWEAAVRDPAVPLVYDVINALDGYPGRASTENRLPTVYNAGHGRLWFRATGGLVRLDTAALRPNTIKPVVRVMQVTADGRTYAVNGALRLPPDTRNVTIDYTAPGLRKPESMRFQYRLDGVDRQWQDAGTRRAAYYTNVGPGSYLFHVRAVNEDGLAGDAVTTVPLAVAPTLTQTWGFRVLCAVAVLLGLYGLYRYRLRIATSAIARQVQVRMDERSRIARTLHDTFLQSVHALTLRVHSVLQKLPQGSEPRTRLEAILDDADRTIEEGRDRVQELRIGDDIARVLERCGADLRTLHPGVAFDMVATGQRRDLAPPVQDELAEMAQEALRNAFRHARATLVTVLLEFNADAFVVRIIDDGCGFDVAARQRFPGRHWGLVGMRERARRIGGTIELGSVIGQGTTVELKVAATLAYV
jgi:ligand-binding sensor domain-containing protein/signal transduction histidine kinase